MSEGIRLEISVDLGGLRFPGPELMAQIDMHVEATARRILRDAQLAIQQPPKSGRLYKRGKKGRMHQASAKGEAPATDTGALAANAGIERTGWAERRVWFAQEYAGILEDPNGLDRPFLAPAVEKHRAGFIKGVEALVEKAL